MDTVNYSIPKEDLEELEEARKEFYKVLGNADISIILYHALSKVIYKLTNKKYSICIAEVEPKRQE